MIKLAEFQSPDRVSGLAKNITCVVQHGYFLGKECEVLKEDPYLEPAEIIQSIENTFYRIVKTSAEASDWIKLQASLTMYEQLLAYRSRNLEMLSLDKMCVFDSLQTKIDGICLTIPKMGEDSDLEMQLQDIFNKCRDRSFAKNYLQALLSYLIVNKRVMEITQKYFYFRTSEVFYSNESRVKYTVLKTEDYSNTISLVAPEGILTSDIDSLSEVDIGLGLRLASFIQEDDENRISFNSIHMSKNEIKRALDVLVEISNREGIAPSLKRFVQYTIDFAFWRYIVSVATEYRNGTYRNEYKAAIQDFHTLFPETSYDSRLILMKQWPFEDIGICKRIFEDNKRYIYLKGDQLELDFDLCFKVRCHLIKYRQIENAYQQIYQQAYQFLFVPTAGMNLKQAKEIFTFQKFYGDRSVVLLSPAEFSGKPPIASKELPKKDPEKESKSPASSSGTVKQKYREPSKKKEDPSSKKTKTSSPAPLSSPETSFPYSPPSAPLPSKNGLKLDPRVQVWFADRAEALKDPKYKDLPPRVQEKTTVFHSIGLEVLDLLVQSGVKSFWGSRKLPHYSLACEVTIQGHEQKYRGIVTICFDEKGTIYHYGYTEKPANLIVAEYVKKRFWDLDFPTLDIAKEKPVRLPVKVNPEDGSFLSRRINNHTFELIDQKNKATVLLFLPEETN